jgi:hypothetical protein
MLPQLQYPEAAVLAWLTMVEGVELAPAVVPSHYRFANSIDLAGSYSQDTKDRVTAMLSVLAPAEPPPYLVEAEQT